MRIIIGGDLVPTSINRELFEKGEVGGLLSPELLEAWNRADYRVFNLEVPFADKRSPIDKCGPAMIVDKACFKGVSALNPSLVLLANNHIMDQGVQGFKSTQKLLEEDRIPSIGAGDSMETMRSSFVLEKDGIRVGIYNCAEREFSIATNEKAGANPFDPVNSLKHIKELKTSCDYVIVVYHGGKELFQYPSPYIQEMAHHMVEKGADLVLIQHSHCVGAREKYMTGEILFGQGNFIFHLDKQGLWRDGLLVEVLVGEGLHVEYIPMTQSDKGMKMEKDQAKIIEPFNERSELIKDSKRHHEVFNRKADELYDMYLKNMLGFGTWMSRIDRYIFRGQLAHRLVKKKNILFMLNYIECESHRELLLQGLKNKLK